MVLTAVEFDFIVKIVLAFVLGAIIGLEREFSEKPAGLRTHVLVSVGAVLFTFVSLSFTDDPARIAAGVVAGIGFLGAGAIIHAKDRIEGLTTAADLWVVAAVGLAIGIGFYFAAITTAFLVFLLLVFGRKVKPFIYRVEKKLG